MLMLTVVGTGEAQWSRDPREAIELPGVYNVNLTTDSLGGVFLDGWAASSDLKTYCLWLDRDGVRHWNNWIDVSPRASETHSSAIALCSEPGELVVAYEVYWYGQDTTQDVRLQKINTEGELLWPDSGLAICETKIRLRHFRYIDDNGEEHSFPYYPGKVSVLGIVTDNEGGIVVAYTIRGNNEQGTVYEQLIYAQRVSAEGELFWGEDGIPIVEREERILTQCGVVSDYNGGAIFKYAINRQIGHWGVQRINCFGERLWSNSGSEYEVGYSADSYAYIADGRGGVITTGLLRPEGRIQINVFHFNAQGEPDWGENDDGIVIVNAPYQARWQDIQIIQTSNDTWFLSWEGNWYYQPFPLIQSITIAGEVSWDSPIRSSEGDSIQHSIMGIKSSEAGLYLWQDSRDFEGQSSSICTQKIGLEGEKLWINDDILVLNRRGMEVIELESDNNGGAFIYMWNNIGYLQYINADGELGIPLRVNNPGEPLDQRVLTYQIFPNPANQTATIFLSSPNVIQTTLSIHDLQGRLIQTNPILPNQSNVSINLQSFPSGQYLIHIESADKQQAQFLQIMK